MDTTAELRRIVWLAAHARLAAGVLDRRNLITSDGCLAKLGERLGRHLSATDAREAEAVLARGEFVAAVLADAEKDFAAEHKPTVWLETAKHVRRITRLLNHDRPHWETIEELARARNRLAGSRDSEMIGLLDNLDRLVTDADHGRTARDGDAVRMARCLMQFLAGQDRSWPVAVLLRIASLHGAGTWFDSLTITRDAARVGPPADPGEWLAEWLVTRLPDHAITPVAELAGELALLAGGKLRLWRREEIPQAGPGWLTGLPPADTLYRQNDWIVRRITPTVTADESGFVAELELEPIPAEEVSTVEEAPPPFDGLFRAWDDTDDSGRRSLLVRMLDELAAAGEKSTDRLLGRIRELAARLGMTVIPAVWTFGGKNDLASLGDRADITLKKKFHPTERAGVVLALRRFGLRAAGAPEAERTAEMEVSMGPEPAGFDAVRRAVKAVQEPGPGCMAVGNRVWRWTDHLLNGTFDREVLSFFADFHGPLGVAWKQEDTPGYDRFREAFASFLKLHYGYSLYQPKTREKDRWDWVELVGNPNPRTNVVSRIVQPGLLDADNCVVLLAKVEMR